jgi:phage protein D
MPDVKLDQPVIKVSGTNLATTIMKNLAEIEVDTSLGMPDMFVLRFHDETFSIVDGQTFALGKEIEIGFADADNPTTPTMLLKGEITAIEPEFSQDTTMMLTIRGYDKSHRLSRGTVIKSYKNIKHSDIVSQIAGSVGLTSDVDATTEVFPQIFQDNVSNLAMVERLAKMNGFALVLHYGKLGFKSHASLNGTSVLTLAWGIDLMHFRPRIALAQQVTAVNVRSYDPKTKDAWVGQASSSTTQPKIGLGKSGVQASNSSLGAATYYEVRQIANSQTHAQKMAEAILNQQNNEFIEAEGTTFGNAKIIAGKKITIASVGTTFSGDYIVTSAIHRYNASEGYITYFRVEGAQTFVTADYLHDKPQTTQDRWYGVYPAIVTNAKDPENQGKIKVKFPWLSDSEESHWARFISPNAGNQRGLMWLPEVNDEVLVVFEQGDFNYPYIVGSTWNGKDAIPFPTTEVVGSSGTIDVKGIKTRSGHILKFTDKSGGEKIEIIDKTGTLMLTFDSTAKKIIVDGASGNIEMKGKDITIETTGNFKVNATGTFEVKSTGTGKVESSAPLTIKGAVVNIN